MLTQRREEDEDKFCLEQITPTYLSSDIFTPDSLPRMTQPNVGQHLVQRRNPKDTLGYHHSEYGGIGDAEILEEKHINEPTFPRSHRHFKGGLKQRYLDMKSADSHTLERWAQRHKASWVDDPGKNASFLHEMFKKYSERSKADECHRGNTIFPRARQFELDYIVARERAGRLQTNDRIDYHQTCDKLTCGKPREQLITRSVVSSMIPPYGLPGPVGNPDDYSFSKYTHYDKEPPNLREDVQVERPERYIPGQIAAIGPIDNRWPCQCPAVQVDDKNRFPVYRGPIHWPASAMEERRKYADLGSPDDEDKTCGLYAQGSQNLIKHPLEDREDIPSNYYDPSSYQIESPHLKHDICLETQDKPVSHRDGVSMTADERVCPHDTRDDKTRALCPVQPGRPYPDPGGILNDKACFESSEKQRKMQLYKVGMPFRTEACRWYNQQFPNEVLPSLEKPKKKIFPEMRFSNL